MSATLTPTREHNPDLVRTRGIITRRRLLAGAGAAVFSARGYGRTWAQDEEPTPTPAVVVVNEAATRPILFWFNWPYPQHVQAAEGLLAAFAEANADIRVELTTGGGYEEDLIAAIVAGDPPDVAHVYDVAALAPRNGLMPLDDFINASSVINPDQYTADQWNAVSWNGVRYAIPALENGPRIGLVWNKGLFEAAGLDPDVGPATLDEMVAFHEQITQVDDTGNLRVIGLDPRDGMGGSESFFQWWGSANGVEFASADGRTLNLNDPMLVQGVQWIADLVMSLGAEKIAGFRSSFDGYLSPNSSFAQGTQGMQINGYWTPGELRTAAAEGQTYGYGWLPTASDSRFMMYGGHSVAIPRGAKDPEAAFRLMEFLTTPAAAQPMFDATGFLNGNAEFFTTGDFASAPDVEWFLNASAEADAGASAPVPVPVFAEVAIRFDAGLDEVVRGNLTPQQMLDDLQNQMQEALDEALEA